MFSWVNQALWTDWCQVFVNKETNDRIPWRTRDTWITERPSAYQGGLCRSVLEVCRVTVLCVRYTLFPLMLNNLITYRTYFLTYLHTYLLTSRSRALLEKLTGSQLVKKFPAFYGTRRFITAFTSARHLSLFWARSVQSMAPRPTSWRSILILSSPLSQGLPSGLFPQVSPPQPYIHLSSPPYVLHAPPFSFFSIWTPEQN